MRFVIDVETKEKVKMDLHDKKILTILALDARIPVTQIAKEVNLSRDAIAHRIKMYNQRGLIQGYKTIVDIKRLGFMNYHLFLRLNNPSKEDETKILKELGALPFVRTIIKFSGKYDLELAVLAKSVEEFESFLEKIVSKCSRFLLDYEIFIITKSYRSGPFPRNFLDLKENKFKKKLIEYALDKKDSEILKLLADHARLPTFRIAEQISLSADAVAYRIKKMKNSGYITGFVPAVNYALLGYSVYAVLMDIRGLVKEEKLKEFFNTDKNILWAVKTIGKYNLLFYIISKTPEGVHETILNLRNYFPEMIRGYETFIASEEYKYTYLPQTLWS